MDMATSVNSFIAGCPPKQPLKTINRSPKFLRNGYNAKGNAAKRKSAVELLQESKAYYVKSEQVLDSKQELKHSEHLQVSSSYPSSYNTRLRNPPHRPLSSGCDVISGSQQGQPSCQQQTTSQRVDVTLNRDIQFIGIEHKMLTVTISNNGNVSGSSQKQKSFTSSRFNTVGPGSLTRTHSATSRTSSNAKHDNLLNGKMSRSPHLRSKTQPEVPLRSHLHEYRRSHSEMEHSNDIQMKLRKLLYTDSKENLSVKHEIISNGQYSEDQLDLAEPFIQPRHHQDLDNYCIHKSMPDLSAGHSHLVKEFNNKCGCDGSMSSSDESINLQAPKSVDIRPSSSWTTSDYASRSPSSRKEQDESNIYLNNNIRNNNNCNNDDSNEEYQENGSFCVDLQIMTSTSSPDGATKRRPILRSKSDISHRYSKSGTDLSQAGSSPKKSSSKAGAELERFFDTFGLDSSGMALLQSFSSDSGSVKFFSSVSTESSSCLPAGGRHRGGSDDDCDGNKKDEQQATVTVAEHLKQKIGDCGNGITNKDLLLHGPLETSIVERNARVIKWLYNCRKLGTLTRRDSAE